MDPRILFIYRLMINGPTVISCAEDNDNVFKITMDAEFISRDNRYMLYGATTRIVSTVIAPDLKYFYSEAAEETWVQDDDD